MTHLHEITHYGGFTLCFEPSSRGHRTEGQEEEGQRITDMLFTEITLDAAMAAVFFKVLPEVKGQGNHRLQDAPLYVVARLYPSEQGVK